jgi:hypothetical protein
MLLVKDTTRQVKQCWCIFEISCDTIVNGALLRLVTTDDQESKQTRNLDGVSQPKLDHSDL